MRHFHTRHVAYKSFFTVKECAAALQISVPTVRRMIKAGQLRPSWFGGAQRIPYSELVALIEGDR